MSSSQAGSPVTQCTQCPFVVLLIKCADFEKHLDSDENFLTLMQNVAWRFSQKQGMQMHTAHIDGNT